MINEDHKKRQASEKVEAKIALWMRAQLRRYGRLRDLTWFCRMRQIGQIEPGNEIAPYRADTVMHFARPDGQANNRNNATALEPTKTTVPAIVSPRKTLLAEGSFIRCLQEAGRPRALILEEARFRNSGGLLKGLYGTVDGRQCVEDKASALRGAPAELRASGSRRLTWRRKIEQQLRHSM